jgi:hypothetical protein
MCAIEPCPDVPKETVWDEARLLAANIVPATGLATDYLNVFNEAVMLLELLPQMPEMLDDLLEWKPLSYEEHFMRSGFKAKELAVAVYRSAAPDLKHAFDQESHCAIQLVSDTIKDVSALIGIEPRLSHRVEVGVGEIQSAIQTLDAFVHFGRKPMSGGSVI